MCQEIKKIEEYAAQNDYKSNATRDYFNVSNNKS